MISIPAILLPNVQTLKGPTRAPVFLDTREMASCNVQVHTFIALFPRYLTLERCSVKFRKPINKLTTHQTTKPTSNCSKTKTKNKVITRLL